MITGSKVVTYKWLNTLSDPNNRKEKQGMETEEYAHGRYPEITPVVMNDPVYKSKHHDECHFKQKRRKTNCKDPFGYVPLQLEIFSGNGQGTPAVNIEHGNPESRYKLGDNCCDSGTLETHGIVNYKDSVQDRIEDGSENQGEHGVPGISFG